MKVLTIIGGPGFGPMDGSHTPGRHFEWGISGNDTQYRPQRKVGGLNWSNGHRAHHLPVMIAWCNVMKGHGV